MSEQKRLCRIEMCRFQREKGSSWEVGLLLNEGDLGIIDDEGKLIEQCWIWYRKAGFVLSMEALFDAAYRELKDYCKVKEGR